MAYKYLFDFGHDGTFGHPLSDQTAQLVHFEATGGVSVGSDELAPRSDFGRISLNYQAALDPNRAAAADVGNLLRPIRIRRMIDGRIDHEYVGRAVLRRSAAIDIPLVWQLESLHTVTLDADHTITVLEPFPAPPPNVNPEQWAPSASLPPSKNFSEVSEVIAKSLGITIETDSMLPMGEIISQGRGWGLLTDLARVDPSNVIAPLSDGSFKVVNLHDAHTAPVDATLPYRLGPIDASELVAPSLVRTTLLATEANLGPNTGVETVTSVEIDIARGEQRVVEVTAGKGSESRVDANFVVALPNPSSITDYPHPLPGAISTTVGQGRRAVREWRTPTYTATADPDVPGDNTIVRQYVTVSQSVDDRNSQKVRLTVTATPHETGQPQLAKVRINLRARLVQIRPTEAVSDQLVSSIGAGARRLTLSTEEYGLRPVNPPAWYRDVAAVAPLREILEGLRAMSLPPNILEVSYEEAQATDADGRLVTDREPGDIINFEIIGSDDSIRTIKTVMLAIKKLDGGKVPKGRKFWAVETQPLPLPATSNLLAIRGATFLRVQGNLPDYGVSETVNLRIRPASGGPWTTATVSTRGGFFTYRFGGLTESTAYEIEASLDSAFVRSVTRLSVSTTPFTVHSFAGGGSRHSSFDTDNERIITWNTAGSASARLTAFDYYSTLVATSAGQPSSGRPFAVLGSDVYIIRLGLRRYNLAALMADPFTELVSGGVLLVAENLIGSIRDITVTTTRIYLLLTDGTLRIFDLTGTRQTTEEFALPGHSESDPYNGISFADGNLRFNHNRDIRVFSTAGVEDTTKGYGPITPTIGGLASVSATAGIVFDVIGSTSFRNGVEVPVFSA